MKKALLISCLVAVLTACNFSQNDSNESVMTSTSKKEVIYVTEKNIEENDSKLVDNNYSSFPFDTSSDENSDSISKPKKITTKLSDEEIAKLNTKKCGFGQGLRLDENNRPYCSLDFNAEFGKYDSFAIKDAENTMFLTFDQGYENGYTAKILDTLKAKNVKATFFILMDYAKRNPELVQRMINEGHTLGNHSVHHYSMPTLDTEKSKAEIQGLHDYVVEEFGYEMSLFRPPMGEYSEQSLAITQACGYETVLWSYAYPDWDPLKQMEPAKALEKVTNASHSGCVYLLHSVSKTNSEILGDFIDNATEKGFTFKCLE